MDSATTIGQSIPISEISLFDLMTFIKGARMVRIPSNAMNATKIENTFLKIVSVIPNSH